MGEQLVPIEFVADESWATYATRAGDDLPIYTDDQILHPVTWMRIANQFFHEQIVTGSWIHVRSHLYITGSPASAQHSKQPQSSSIDLTLVPVERAILDVRISADGSPSRHTSTKPSCSLPRTSGADAQFIARHTRSAVAGMSMCCTPRCASASITAFCTAGVAPIVPDSPMPLAPSGLRGVGVSCGIRSNIGSSAAEIERVLGQVGSLRVAVFVVDKLLHQRLCDP